MSTARLGELIERMIVLMMSALLCSGIAKGGDKHSINPPNRRRAGQQGADRAFRRQGNQGVGGCVRGANSTIMK
jgi:hypothetical protein